MRVCAQLYVDDSLVRSCSEVAANIGTYVQTLTHALQEPLKEEKEIRISVEPFGRGHYLEKLTTNDVDSDRIIYNKVGPSLPTWDPLQLKSLETLITKARRVDAEERSEHTSLINRVKKNEVIMAATPAVLTSWRQGVTVATTLKQLYQDEASDPCKRNYTKIMQRFDASQDDAISSATLFQQVVRQGGGTLQSYLCCGRSMNGPKIFALHLPSIFIGTFDSEATVWDDQCFAIKR